MDSCCALYQNCLCLLKAYGLKSLDELSSSEKDLRAKLRQFDILRDEKRIAALWNLIEDSGIFTNWFTYFSSLWKNSFFHHFAELPRDKQGYLHLWKKEIWANHVSEGTFDGSVAVDMDDDLLSQDDEEDTEESVKDEL